MPSETRLLKFTNDELQTALFQYSQPMGESARRASITKVEISQAGKVSAILHISNQEPAIFDAPHIAAALIRFCITRKIPLPKKATKSLHIQGKHAVLVLKYGDDPSLQVPS